MSNTTKILEQATDILAECLQKTYPKHITPYIKEKVDSAQELLLDLLIDLKQ